MSYAMPQPEGPPDAASASPSDHPGSGPVDPPSGELAKQYDPVAIEKPVTERWLAAQAFHARPDPRDERYVVMMPLPNVTGALHMGHAMDNVMQDLLIRWHRMLGDNTLWMAGTDHAGIATQAVVERRLLELEGKTRHDLGRERLIERIWAWKDQYQQRIVSQQRAMGCSCDWQRQRFTMDAVCTRAVRHTFFRMFRDGLIYRGNRLVNWDCFLRTAVADDEIEHRPVPGHFWHLRYPVIDPAPGEPTHVVVATTRPETLLGDTAVAVHPAPRAALARALAATRERLAGAAEKDRAALEQEVERLVERERTHLPQLERLAAMARAGRQVRLPLAERAIPLILDEWAKPELGSGCVKITPAHDPNDHEVWKRHQDRIGIVNILNPDGTLNEQAGTYQGQDRLAARPRVVADLEARGLLEAVEERVIELGHSDRSKTPVEPYLSLQWFVRMGDVEGGIVCGRGTPLEFRADGLAQAAIDAVSGAWRSATGRKLAFHPDPVRYGNTYVNWLAEKRDWCISRQLWWGHRIPIWAATPTANGAGSGTGTARDLGALVAALRPHHARADFCAWAVGPRGDSVRLDADTTIDALHAAGCGEGTQVLACLLDEDTEGALAGALEALGMERDPDVLDTWFSSGLWPHSTLGWPDPATAPVDPGQAPLGAADGQPDCLSYYYPGACLVTGRDIITLWVARMVMLGLYNLGDLPFTDCFLHANILDGKGERMSKSKGNGIDPVDIIEAYGTDAMRYVLCDMQTGSQDIRLPVQALSPFTGKAIDLATARRGRGSFTYLCPDSGQEFDVLGSMPGVPAAKLVSDRFEVGRNFCNKLWNAARFTLMNLETAAFEPRARATLASEDRWILSRLAAAATEVDAQLRRYNPSAALGAAREFFWTELCDWYLEMVKPRLRDEVQAPAVRQVLAAALDQVLRLLQPFVPFITEALWERLCAQAPRRGIETELRSATLLVHAPWPAPPAAWRDPALETRVDQFRDLVRTVRDLRARHGVPPRQELDLRVRATGETAATLAEFAPRLGHLAALGTISIAAEVQRTADCASAVIGAIELHVPGVVDPAKERARLAKKLAELEGRVTGAQKKLSNPGFLANAAAEVVERERTRLAELEDEQRTLTQLLAELEG